MGNSASQDGLHQGHDGAAAAEDDEYAAQFDGIDTLGYRVLGVQPQSPASEAGLVSFLDFIVGANHQMLMGSSQGLEVGEEYDDVDFPALLRDAASKNETVELLVWNLKAQDQRVVTLRPRDGWGGAGLLGVTIRLDNYGGAEERLVRVLEVEPYSPAADCGLMDDGTDYLLGTTAVALETTDVLASVLHQHIDQIVELYVYNSETDLVRVVGLMPTYKWSNGRVGGGMLGAEVGTGYLHRLPEKCRHTIGQSVERTVQVLAGNSENGDGNNKPSDNGLSSNGATGGSVGGGTASLTVTDPNMIQMEPHLEMEVLEDDDDRNERTTTGHGVRRDDVDKDVMRSGATPRSPRSPRNVYSTRQPHQLGVPTPSKATGTEAADTPPPPPSLEHDETDRDIGSRRGMNPHQLAERQGSLTSVSMSSEAAGKEYEQVEEAVGGHNSITTNSAGGDDHDDGHDLDEDAVVDMAMAEKTDEAEKELEQERMIAEPSGGRGHDDGDIHDSEEEDDTEDVSSDEEGDEDLSSSEEEEEEEMNDEHDKDEVQPGSDPHRPATPPPASDPDFPQAAPVVESEPPAENVTRKKQEEREDDVSTSSQSPSPPPKPKVETVDTSKGDEEDGYDSHSYHDDDDDDGSYETDDEYTDEEETDDDDSPKKKKGFFW
mmetsp:Transcript_56552/g.137295  ORF Transcript_56552/g.137295 Transcript_56552/m.137295 type:complete len:659 (-) Transcript_56552:58-2034(-)